MDGRFSRHLTHGHSIAHAALDDATRASHFTRTSSPNFSVSSFVSPSVSASGVGGSDHEFVLAETPSFCLLGNKDLECEYSGQGWAASLEESMGLKAFSMVLRGSCVQQGLEMN